MVNHDTPSDARNSMRCEFCSKGFLHKSSLTRHVKRCSQSIKGPPRRKACRQCARSKLRCDLERPHCGSCQDRAIACEFENPSDSSSPKAANFAEPSTTSTVKEQSLVRSVREFAIKRQHELTASVPDTLRGSSSTGYAVDLTIRVLRSWARQVAIYKLELLPPMIHHVQLEHVIPQPLTNCCLLAAMWADSKDNGSKLVFDCSLREIERLLTEHMDYKEQDLLAAAQSLLFLLTIVLFGLDPALALPPYEAVKLITNVWEVKTRLAATNLCLPEEQSNLIPSWMEWSVASAKRRTLLALNQLEWAWSLLHGYPELSCIELGPLPVPAAKHIWQARNEKEWEQLYRRWLPTWEDGLFVLSELFAVRPGKALSERAERWLAESDEFGIMLMTEVGVVSTRDSVHSIHSQT